MILEQWRQVRIQVRCAKASNVSGAMHVARCVLYGAATAARRAVLEVFCIVVRGLRLLRKLELAAMCVELLCYEESLGFVLVSQ